MAVALIWVEALALSLLFATLGASYSLRFEQFRSRVACSVLSFLLPFALLSTLAVLAYYLWSGLGGPLWWLFAYFLSLTLIYTVASLLVLLRALSGDRVEASGRWPFRLPRKSLTFAALFILFVFTIWTTDNSRRVELLSVYAALDSSEPYYEKQPIDRDINSAVFYDRAIRAFKEIGFAGDDVMLMAKGTEPSFDVNGSEARYIMEKMAVPLALFKKGAALPAFYCITCTTDGFGFELQYVRYAAWLLATDSRIKASAGDYEGAVEDLLAIFRISDHLSNDQPFVTQLISLAIDAIGVSTTENLLYDYPAIAEQLLASGSLSDNRFHENFWEAFRYEHFISSKVTAYAFSTTSSSSWSCAWDFFEDECDVNPVVDFFIPPLFRIYLARHEISRLEVFDIKWNDMRDAPPFEARRDIEGVLEEVGGSLYEIGILSSLMMYLNRVDIEVARRRLLEAAVAVAAYRNKTGLYPDTLASLVPVYIDKVPVDPFDGKPIKMKGVEGGFVLYSVAADGTDGGGVWSFDDARGDITFLLGAPFKERRIKVEKKEG